MRRFTEVAVVLLLALPACGGGAGVDAGPGGPTIDAALYPVECEADFGKSYVLWQFGLVPAGEGLDITGDGVPDNAIGFIRPVVNPAWQSAVDDGVATYLVEVSDWDPIGPNDAQVTMATYLGLDADDPPDPSNNLGGQGEFLVPADQYDVNCRPLSTNEGASLTDGVIEVQGREWKFLAPD